MPIFIVHRREHHPTIRGYTEISGVIVNDSHIDADKIIDKLNEAHNETDPDIRDAYSRGYECEIITMENAQEHAGG